MDKKDNKEKTEFEPGQLRWRCRRGMRELDAALVAYLDHHYKDADDAEKQIFHELLALPDPELMQHVAQRQRTDTPESAESIAASARFEVILKKIRTTLIA